MSVYRQLWCQMCAAMTPHDTECAWLHCARCGTCWGCGARRNVRCDTCRRTLLTGAAARDRWLRVR